MEGIKFTFDLSEIKSITINQIKEDIKNMDIPAMENKTYTDYKVSIKGNSLIVIPIYS